ncbi:MAG: hypothetical protein ABIV06_00490, partial [Thermoanaerobaculia bacterium]
LREALTIRRAVLEPSHPDLERSIVALGTFLCVRKRSEEGAALLGEALNLASAAPALAAEAKAAKAALATCASP